MVKLVAQSPCRGLLPVEHGQTKLTEVEPDAITSVAPFKGKTRAVSDALKASVSAGFPRPNRRAGRVVWSGRGQAMVLGPRPVGLDGLAALTDQSDAWAVVRLEGATAEEVLARLVPLDLSPETFKQGHAARTLLQHMTVILTRTGANSFEIMAFRSMGRTLVHDLDQAMRSVAARDV